jgi:DNA-binding winged helix-turn-helix (wHTH) protein
MRDLQATYGELDIDARAWEARLGGAVVDLTRTEFEILALLASRPREVVTDEEITREIWGHGWFGDDNNLAVHVSKLRRKLGESGSQPRYIRTVRGVGYRFEPGRDSALSADGPCRIHPSALHAVDIITLGGVREWTARHVLKLADGSLVQADFATYLLVDRDGRLEGLHLALIEREGPLWGFGGGGDGCSPDTALQRV